MNVKIAAFELLPSANLSIADFAYQLEMQSSKQFGEYLMPVTQTKGFVVGVLLRIRDAQQLCLLKQTLKSYTVTTQDLEQGTNLVDFNFFLIQPKTGRGLYQHYHHSVSIVEFLYLMRQKWRTFKDAQVKTEIAPGASDAAVNSVKKKYKGFLKDNIIVRSQNFDTKVAALRKITSLRFSVASIAPGKSRFSALEGEATRWSADFYFGDQSNITKIKDTVRDLVTANAFRRAQVEGIDSQGNPAIFKSVNDIDSFGEFPFKDFAKKLSLDFSDAGKSLQKTPAMVQLLKVAADPDVDAILNAPVAK